MRCNLSDLRNNNNDTNKNNNDSSSSEDNRKDGDAYFAADNDVIMGNRIRDYCTCTGTARQGWLTVFGGVMISLTCGSLYSFGNLVTYLVSFVRSHGREKDITYQTVIICGGLMWGTSGIGMALSGMTEKRYGVRKASLIGCVFAWIGLFCSTWSIKISFYMLLVTYGCFFGFGAGLASVAVCITAMKWFPERKGLMSGLIQGSFGLSALFFNFIQTAFINPSNLSPNELVKFETRTETYYSQESILRRVPLCFLLQGSILFLTNCVGILLLGDPPVPASHSSPSSSSSSTSSSLSTLLSPSPEGAKELNILPIPTLTSTTNVTKSFALTSKFDQTDETANESVGEHERLLKSVVSSSNKPSRYVKSTESAAAAAALPCGVVNSSDVFSDHQSTNGAVEDEPGNNDREKGPWHDDVGWSGDSLTTRQVLLRTSYWQFFAMISALTFAGSTFSESYKSFALEFLHDDLYLSGVGSITSVFSFLGHLLTGVFIDHVSVAATLVALTGSMSALLLSVSLTTLGGYYLLPFWACSILFVLGGNYAVLPVFLMRVYGAENFAINYAFTVTFGITAVLVLGSLAVALLQSFLAWSTLYISIGVMCMLAMVFGMFMKLTQQEPVEQTRR